MTPPPSTAWRAATRGRPAGAGERPSAAPAALQSTPAAPNPPAALQSTPATPAARRRAGAAAAPAAYDPRLEAQLRGAILAGQLDAYLTLAAHLRDAGHLRRAYELLRLLTHLTAEPVGDAHRARAHDTGAHDTGAHDTGAHDTGAHRARTHDTQPPRAQDEATSRAPAAPAALHARALAAMGLVNRHRGRLDHAAAQLTAAVAALQHLNLPRDLAAQQHNLALTHYDRGDLDHAHDTALAALHLNETQHAEPALQKNLHLLDRIYAAMG